MFFKWENEGKVWESCTIYAIIRVITVRFMRSILLCIYGYCYIIWQRVLVSVGRHEEALVVAERGRTRAFVDLLLEKQTLGSERHLVDQTPVTIEQILDTVSKQTAAVLYYSVAAGFLYSWLITPDQGG